MSKQHADVFNNLSQMTVEQASAILTKIAASNAGTRKVANGPAAAKSLAGNIPAFGLGGTSQTLQNAWAGLKQTGKDIASNPNLYVPLAGAGIGSTVAAINHLRKPPAARKRRSLPTDLLTGAMLGGTAGIGGRMVFNGLDKSLPQPAAKDGGDATSQLNAAALAARKKEVLGTDATTWGKAKGLTGLVAEGAIPVSQAAGHMAGQVAAPVGVMGAGAGAGKLLDKKINQPFRDFRYLQENLDNLPKEVQDQLHPAMRDTMRRDLGSSDMAFKNVKNVAGGQFPPAQLAVMKEKVTDGLSSMFGKSFNVNDPDNISKLLKNGLLDGRPDLKQLAADYVDALGRRPGFAATAKNISDMAKATRGQIGTSLKIPKIPKLRGKAALPLAGAALAGLLYNQAGD